MNAPPSIVDLFAKLALHLQSPLNQEEEEEESRAVDASISQLNQSLNLNGNPNPESGFRVLDTALSLLCFKAPQVFETNIEYQLKTIVSVLSSSVTCKVWRVQNQESLQIGSSISRSNCIELLEMCEDLLEKLEGRGVLPNLLLDAVVRWAVSASQFKHLYPVTSIIDVKSSERSPAVSNLYCHLRRDLPHEYQDIPLRLLFWYLDPLTLKQTVSEILQETIKRPFLCLSEEFHLREDWRASIVCLALSPATFSETRALLHNWFLMTGLDSILDLAVGIVAATLDLISIPTSWGLTMELGSKLPFSGAYFPSNSHLMRLLAGSLSSENFLNLADATCGQFSHGRKQIHRTLNPNAMEIARTDHKSLWVLAIHFPQWFYFASFLLFSGSGTNLQESLQSKCTLGKPEVGEMNDKKSLSTAAARYIAWILSPISKYNQELLVECLTKTLEYWTQELFGLGRHNEEAGYSKKKPKKRKILDRIEIHAPMNEKDSEKMRTWLREIQNIYKQCTDRSTDSETTASHVHSLQQNVLLRRILLGVIVMFPSYITEDGCELLLHYAATGRILQPRKTMTAGRCNDSSACSDEFGKGEASAGVCLVFSLTDFVESISASFSATEENALDFIFQVKLKCGKYLIKCVERLIELNIQEDGVLMLQDLVRRLARWRHQATEVFLFQTDIEDVTNVLNCILSSLSEYS